MFALNRRALIIGLAMLLSMVLAAAMKPTLMLADSKAKIDLATMIPKQFGNWKIDDKIIPIQVDPQQLAQLDRIYNQTLARTFINQKGDRVMLSIAYGGDQSDSMQVHKPEVCYTSQGFQMLTLVPGVFDTGFGNIPVKRLLAVKGTRIEPIIYWMTIGETITNSSFEWKLAQIQYGLTGKIPDGMIFRVSSLGDQSTAYAIQEDFIRVLLKVLSPDNRKRLIGSTTPPLME